MGSPVGLLNHAWLGAAHAASPDVHCAHPGLRSLDGGYAFGILPALAANAGSTARTAPRWDALSAGRRGTLFAEVLVEKREAVGGHIDPLLQRRPAAVARAALDADQEW